MGLLSPLMIKTVLGASDLTLKPESGKSFLVRDIRINNPAQTHINIKIEKALVGFLRVGTVLGSHLPFPFKRSKHSHNVTTLHGDAGGAEVNKVNNAGGESPAVVIGVGTTVIAAETTFPRSFDLEKTQVPDTTLLSLLAKKGIFKGFPVETGQTLTITGANQANAIQQVLYQEYAEGDIKRTDENGSDSNEYFFLNYGNCGVTIATAADSLFNTQVTPVEFPRFPFDDVVPAKSELTIYGILGSEYSPAANDNTDAINTRYIKLVKERTTLFDNDRNGLLFHSPYDLSIGSMNMIGEGFSDIGNYTDVDARQPLFFPEPLVFLGGEELNIYLTTVVKGAGKNLVISEQEIGLIMKMKRV